MQESTVIVIGLTMLVLGYFLGYIVGRLDERHARD